MAGCLGGREGGLGALTDCLALGRSAMLADASRGVPHFYRKKLAP